MNTLKVISWRVLLVGTVFAVIVAGIAAFRNQNQGYDYEASIAKLRRIGQALQLYRQEWGVKPVEEWQELADTGLPPDGLYQLMRPGQPWSLPPEVFTVEQPYVGFRTLDVPCHFMVTTLRFMEGYAGTRPPAGLLRERGERLPIVVDFNMNSGRDMHDHPESLEAIVLRMDGTVEMVRWNQRDPLDILRR